MAWTYLAVSEDSPAHWNHGCESEPTVRSTDMHRQFYCRRCLWDTCRWRPSGMTCELCELDYSLPWTSSPAGSPARTSVLQDLERAWVASEAVYIGSCIDSSSNSNRDGSSSRTSRRSGPVVSAKWSGHLPMSGMIVGGLLFQPPRLVPRTSDVDGSLLPTPRASDIRGEGKGAASMRIHNGKGATLAGYVKLWPTPTVRDSNTIAKCRRGANATQGGTPLPIAVGGTLNPTWVEWLMGYQSGWTELKDWAMLWFRSRPAPPSAD